jgi:hypothetical protein
VAYNHRHHYEEDQPFKAGMQLEDLIHVLDQHLALLHDLQDTD